MPEAIPDLTFEELGVLPEIADALERVGIAHPFPIQEMTLSVALMGTDLIGQARTGTGKTLAFGIPLLQRTVAAARPGLRGPAAPGQAAGAGRRPDPRARAAGLQRPRRRRRRPRLRVLTVYGGVGYDDPARRPQDGRRRRRRHAGPPARPGQPPGPRPRRTSRCWSSTRPTRCSTWASCPTSSG